MSLKPRRWLGTAAPLVLGMLLVACRTVPARLEPPAPATLASVRNLAPHRCNVTTAVALDGLGVPPDQIKSVLYDQQVSGNKNYLQGYDALVQVNDQSEGLVAHDLPERAPRHYINSSNICC
jgi:hypothetical protein